MCRNIPAAPAYGLYISQLIRYSRNGDFYQGFINKGFLLTRKLLNQGFLLARKILNQGFLLVNWKLSLRHFSSRPIDLVNRYICVTNDHSYFPFIVVTISSFFLFYDLLPDLYQKHNLLGAFSETVKAYT